MSPSARLHSRQLYLSYECCIKHSQAPPGLQLFCASSLNRDATVEINCLGLKLVRIVCVLKPSNNEKSNCPEGCWGTSPCLLMRNRIARKSVGGSSPHLRLIGVKKNEVAPKNETSAPANSIFMSEGPAEWPVQDGPNRSINARMVSPKVTKIAVGLLPRSFLNCGAWWKSRNL
jgi:hypothetical protein